MRALTLLLFLSCVSIPIFAREVSGVQVPDTLVVSGAEAPLVLNGAGVRKRLFVKVYVGALYLPARASRVEDILATEGARVMSMHILHSEIDHEKLADAWRDGLRDNTSAAEFESLSATLREFNLLFRGVRRGETLRIDLLPNGETRVTINAELRGAVTDAAFQRALLKVWLGEKPVDADLRRALLGAAD